MSKSIFAVAFLALSAGLLPSQSQAASPGFCADYAEHAVRQYNRSRAVCYHGTNRGWHGNYNLHYGWCLRAHYAAAQSEAARRRAMLRACG
jgi:hypothetical protein